MGDPYIYSWGGTYYLTGTTGEKEGFLGYESQDLKTWKPMGFLYRREENPWGRTAYWAPEVFAGDGRFYMTYSCLHSQKDQLCMGLAVSRSPRGPFSDLYAPWFDFGFGSIDGHIFQDEDKKRYLYFSRNGYDQATKTAYGVNYVVKLREDMSGPEGEPVLIGQADSSWETVLQGNRCNEGPTVWKQDGVYYLTYSANDTFSPAYGVGYMTALHPMGPWKKSPDNPILTSGGAVLSPGHNSIFMSLDGKRRYIAYHALESVETKARYVCISQLKTEQGKLTVLPPDFEVTL